MRFFGLLVLSPTNREISMQFSTPVLVAILVFVSSSIALAGERITIDSAGFATPESVEYYADKDVYLVGNINGSPVDKDDNGFISMVAPNGKVLVLKWIDGNHANIRLDAPKGLAINDDVLYVADLDQVHFFQLPGGEQIRSVSIPGATFLNGITPNPVGGVFVTDSGLKAGEGGLVPSGTDAVYEVTASGKYRAILKDPDMGRPNGIVHSNGVTTIVTIETGEVISFTASGKVSRLPVPGVAGLDGLLLMHDGSYVISSWKSQAIYRLDSNGRYQILDEALESPADLGFDSKRNLILVPLFNKNQLVALPYRP